MELMGLCTTCGKSAVLSTCILCGRLVCDACFDARRSVCKQCQIK